jgi:hypothetical protein
MDNGLAMKHGYPYEHVCQIFRGFYQCAFILRLLVKLLRFLLKTAD